METQLRTEVPRYKLIALGLAPTLLALGTLLSSSADAHRSGCHRWHSCPSDSGSYTCGDLGYTNYCDAPAPVKRPAQSYSAPVAAKTAVLNDGPIKFRANPSTQAKILMKLSKGTRVNLGACGVEWCAVRYAGKSGWMMKKYLNR